MGKDGHSCGSGGCGCGGQRVPLGIGGGGGAIRRAPMGGDVVNRGPREEDEIDEGPQAADIERFSHVTKACPACKKDVFDDTAICYHCGHAFERTTAGSGKTPIWIIATIAVLILALILGTISGVIKLF
jgi:hypothetical protein